MITKAAATILCTLVASVASAAPAAPTAPTGPKQEELRIQARAGSQLEETMCTADGTWCVTRPVAAADNADDEVDRTTALTVTHKSTGKSRVVATIPLFEGAPEAAEAALWPSIVRLSPAAKEEVAFIGVLQTERHMYSGGGASATRLTLYDVGTRRDHKTRPILNLPHSSSIQIRACFTEADVAKRHDACSDEYTYRSTLTLDPNSSAPLRLIYKSHAETYPGALSRSEDSTKAPPLAEKDLQPAVNEECSVERTLTRNAETGSLEWNEQLPPCTDFLEP